MSETARLITQLAEARAIVARGELRLWAATEEANELEVERDEARANAERLRITLAEQDNELELAREDVRRLTSERDAAQAEAERLKEQVAALTVAVEQADEAKADAEAAAAREEAETDRVVADGNRALADVERLTVELHETREKLARVQVQYDEFAKVTAKVIDKHQRERDHARQQVYLLREAGADRPSDEDFWREAFMTLLPSYPWEKAAEHADRALAEYRKRWPR